MFISPLLVLLPVWLKLSCPTNEIYCPSLQIKRIFSVENLITCIQWLLCFFREKFVVSLLNKYSYLWQQMKIQILPTLIIGFTTFNMGHQFQLANQSSKYCIWFQNHHNTILCETDYFEDNLTMEVFSQMWLL